MRTLNYAHCEALLVHIVRILRSDIVLLTKRVVELKIVRNILSSKRRRGSYSIKATSANALDFRVLIEQS